MTPGFSEREVIGDFGKDELRRGDGLEAWLGRIDLSPEKGDVEILNDDIQDVLKKCNPCL